MSSRRTDRGLDRRDVLSTALALSGSTAGARLVGPSGVWAAASQRPLNPFDPDILFGSTSALWGGQHDIDWAIKRIAVLGLQGIEPRQPD